MCLNEIVVKIARPAHRTTLSLAVPTGEDDTVYYHRLRELEQSGTIIQVGLIAAGTFGTQITTQISAATGMRLAAIAELDPARAVRAYGLGGI
jgi:hypothetical protein